MRGPVLIIVLTLPWYMNAYSDDSANSLSFEFETAIASIAPRSTNLPVQFPDLTFVLRAEPRCSVPESTAFVSVSIADSQSTIVPDGEQQGRIEETINVSHKQLGPIVVDDFCVADDSESLQYLELEGALSAHLSLRCRAENYDSISYATAALNVAIQCENDEVKSPEAGEPVAE